MAISLDLSPMFIMLSLLMCNSSGLLHSLSWHVFHGESSHVTFNFCLLPQIHMSTNNTLNPTYKLT